MEKAYSQLPVGDGEKIVGSVTERTMNRRMMSGDPEKVKNSPVSAVMEALPTVSVNTPVATIISLLQNCQAVLTVENGKIEGIITNIDVGKIFTRLK